MSRAAHLSVEGLRADLKRRAVRSGASVLAAQAAAAILAVATIAILARFLPASDFGLVAMAFPVVMIANVLRSFGLDVALINRERLDPELVDSVFWLSLLLNLLLAAAVAASSVVLVWFYGEPRLTGITLVFAAGILLFSLGATPEALLKRQMRFEALSIISVMALAVGAIVAVSLAAKGLGYWALVSQTVAAFAVRSLLAWVVCKWRPHFSN